MSQIYVPSTGGGGGGGEITLTGNTGGPLGPSSSFTIVTDNTNVLFRGASTTLTLDFGFSTNLLLGVDGSILTVGVGNTSCGVSALDLITSGQSNAAFGHAAMGSGVSVGNFNTACGEGAMFSCGGGVSGSVAVGWHTMIGVSGNYNTGVGYDSMNGGISGVGNVGVGFQSLKTITTGNLNVCVGNLSGSAYSSSESNNICIANDGVVGESNAVRMGNENSTDCYISGIVEESLSDENVVVIDIATDQLGIVAGKPQVIIKSPLLNMLGGGERTVFTPARDFIIQGVLSYSVNVAGLANDSQSSIGFNSPAYDNVISAGVNFPITNGEYTFGVLNTSNNASLPSGTPLILNMTTPDSTATTFDVTVYITGFYV